MTTLIALAMNTAAANPATNYSLTCADSRVDIRITAAVPALGQGFQEDLTVDASCGAPSAGDLQVLGTALGQTCVAEGFANSFCDALVRDTLQSIDNTVSLPAPVGANVELQAKQGSRALAEIVTPMSDRSATRWAAMVMPTGAFVAMTSSTGPAIAPYTNLDCIARSDARAEGVLNSTSQAAFQVQDQSNLQCTYSQNAFARIDTVRSLRAVGQ